MDKKKIISKKDNNICLFLAILTFIINTLGVINFILKSSYMDTSNVLIYLLYGLTLSCIFLFSSMIAHNMQKLEVTLK